MPDSCAGPGPKAASPAFQKSHPSPGFLTVCQRKKGSHPGEGRCVAQNPSHCRSPQGCCQRRSLATSATGPTHLPWRAARRDPGMLGGHPDRVLDSRGKILFTRGGLDQLNLEERLTRRFRNKLPSSKGNSRALLSHFGIGYPVASMQAQDQEVTQKESLCVVQNIVSVALSEVLFRRWGSSPILISLCACHPVAPAEADICGVLLATTLGPLFRSVPSKPQNLAVRR